MRVQILLFWLCLIPLFGYSQQLSPQVTNLAGTDSILGNQVITTSVGEPAIITLTSGQSILTQGFLQPEILPCEKIEFTYYPNPAIDNVTILADGCEVVIQSLQLVDVWGRTLYTGKLDKLNQLYVGDLSQGMYIVYLTLSNQTKYSIQLIKISE
jgi:hypothetical protein